MILGAVEVKVLHHIENGNGEVTIESGVSFIGNTNPEGKQGGIGFKVKRGNSTEGAVLIEGEAGVVGAVHIKEREGEGGIGIGIGGIELPDCGICRLVFQNSTAVEIKGGGGIVGKGGGVAGIGTIGEFKRIGKSIIIIVGIEVILNAVGVKVLHHIEDGNGEIIFHEETPGIADPDTDGKIGGVEFGEGFVVKDLVGGKRTVGFEAEF